MPPKNPNAAGQKGKPPQWATNRPIPFQAPNHIKEAFLPYLARGFTPRETAGGDRLLCAYYALRISLRAAMRFLGLPNSEKITVQALRAIVDSQEFKDEFVGPAVEAYKAIDPRGIKRFKERTEWNKMLDSNHLYWLLQLVNRKFGTDFDLGVVLEGFRCRWRNAEKSWELDYVSPHSLIMPGDGNAPTNRPVVWVWNNQADVRAVTHGGSSNTAGHWEGFADGPSNAEHAKRVRDWGLGSEIREDIKNIVYRVITDHRSSENTPNLLDVRVGTFLRPFPPPSGTAPDGYVHLRTSEDGQATNGEVIADSLEQIDLHEDAPEEFDVADAITKADSGAKDSKNKDPKTKYLKKRNVVNADGNFLPFKIFKVVPEINKLGEELDPKDKTLKFWISGEEINNGTFLYDEGIRERATPSATVTEINGESGEAHLRRLQSLESPWGLQQEIVLLPSDPSKLKVADLDKILQSAGEIVKGLKAAKVERINHLASGIYLYRFNMEQVHIDNANPFQRIEFHPTEIVRLVERFMNENGQELARIVDFENHATDIGFEHLDEIENPFGLDLEKALIIDKFSKKEDPNSSQSPDKSKPSVSREGRSSTPKKITRVEIPDSDDDEIDKLAADLVEDMKKGSAKKATPPKKATSSKATPRGKPTVETTPNTKRKKRDLNDDVDKDPDQKPQPKRTRKT